MSDFLSVGLEAARIGGDILMEWRDKFKAREKGPRDLVTEADTASQEAIRNVILGAFPDHDFLGEEEAADRKASGLAAIAPRKSEYRWIVDPLDGTSNYVHRMQNFAVSIGLQKGDELVLGVVYDPNMQEMFAARLGEGATLNGRPIKVSGCQQLSQAMAAVSFSPNVPRGSIEITRFVEVLHASQAVRRLGSAALNLCYLADGRLDSYWATSVCAWDVAAGAVIVKEAGGVITAIGGGPLDIERPEMLASASPSLHNEVLEMLAEAEKLHRR